MPGQRDLLAVVEDSWKFPAFSQKFVGHISLHTFHAHLKVDNVQRRSGWHTDGLAVL